jgi:hypothetical protein
LVTEETEFLLLVLVDYDISQLSMSKFSRSREKYITEQELMSIYWIKLPIYLYLFYIVESGVKDHYPSSVRRAEI